MCLLDDVCLIESEILVPPIVSMLDWSSTSCTWPSSYELSDSWEALAYKSWNYDPAKLPSLAENPWKNSRLVASPRDLLRTRSLTVPVPKELHNVEYKHSRVADIILQVGWETITSHTVCGQLYYSGEYLLSSLLGACTYYTLLKNRKEVCAY